MITHLHINGADGDGVIVRPYSKVRDGYFMVEAEGLRIPIEEQRIESYDEYWEKRRRTR